MEEVEKTTFEKRIKPLLKYVGLIGSILTAIAYIITVCVLVFGFETKEKNLSDILVFSIVNAVVGFIIMQFLKLQGIDFAKDLPDNRNLIEKYYGTTTKDKKTHSINYFWITSIIKDIFIKALSVAAATIGIIKIIIEGMNDYSMFLIAAINLIMFISFGLLSLVKAYDYYNNYHVKFMKDALSLRKE